MQALCTDEETEAQAWGPGPRRVLGPPHEPIPVQLRLALRLFYVLGVNLLEEAVWTRWAPCRPPASPVFALPPPPLASGTPCPPCRLLLVGGSGAPGTLPTWGTHTSLPDRPRMHTHGSGHLSGVSSQHPRQSRSQIQLLVPLQPLSQHMQRPPLPQPSRPVRCSPARGLGSGLRAAGTAAFWRGLAVGPAEGSRGLKEVDVGPGEVGASMPH